MIDEIQKLLSKYRGWKQQSQNVLDNPLLYDQFQSSRSLGQLYILQRVIDDLSELVLSDTRSVQ